MMLTRDQQYAEAVWKRIEQYQPEQIEAKKYGSVAHKIPVLIRSAGLLQTLAYCTSKFIETTDPRRSMTNHFAEIILNDAAATAQDLMNYVKTLDILEYMQYTRKALAVSSWFKRFAESHLKVKATDATDDERGE
jgi:CRISPR-associated protein Cmr5